MASVREAKRGIGDAAEKGEDAARDTAGEARDEMHRLREKLQVNGARLEEELRDAGSRLGEGARTLRDALSEQVREHPLAAFGIAFAAGVVLSRALRSR